MRHIAEMRLASVFVGGANQCRGGLPVVVRVVRSQINNTSGGRASNPTRASHHSSFGDERNVNKKSFSAFQVTACVLVHQESWNLSCVRVVRREDMVSILMRQLVETLAIKKMEYGNVPDATRGSSFPFASSSLIRSGVSVADVCVPLSL